MSHREVQVEGQAQGRGRGRCWQGTMQLSPATTHPRGLHGVQASHATLERILIVDDEASIRRVLAARLRLRGYHVSLAGDGPSALRCLEQATHHLVLLDIKLPDQDGFKVLEHIRQRSDVPVLMLTACGTVADRITALRCGADDYLIKPFSLIELEARVRCLLRRSGAARQRLSDEARAHRWPLIQIDDLTIILHKRQILRGGIKARLTGVEASILELLVAANGQPVSREDMLRRIWGYSPEECAGLRHVDRHVSQLRHKLEANPDQPALILTERGFGYMFCKLKATG